MAVIVFANGIDPITGSRRGVTFDVSQAGSIAKRKPSPVNHQTTDRMKVRAILKATNEYFWNLTHLQKMLWGGWADDNGIQGPYSYSGYQWGCAGFFAVELNAALAGDPFYPNPPGPLPLPGVTFTNLIRLDKDTIQATFHPSPAGLTNRIYLRQGRPGPGVRRWSVYDGYIAEVSPLNPASPYDFTTHFQHPIGWHGRYWTGTQEDTGRRSTEDLWDL